MQSLLDDPMVQAAVAPFAAALVVATLLMRTRLAWLALLAAIATVASLTTGIAFQPLSAARKVLLLVLLAPWLGLLLDFMPRPHAALQPAVSVLFGLASLWVFGSVLSQRETPHMLALGGGVALFVALLVALMLRLRDDGARGGSATVALGLGVGVAAFLSASIGSFMSGVALAAAGAALLLLQFISSRVLAPGHIGTLTAGVAAALYASATFLLAELPWYALPLLLLVPLAAKLPVAGSATPRVRMVALSLVSLAASAAPMLAAWFAATRASGS